MSLGKKYTCYKCKTKFYDLGKPEPICPKCGADQRNDPHPSGPDAVVAKLKASGSSKSSKRTVKEDDEPELEEEFPEEAEDAFEEEEDDFGDYDEGEEEADDEDYE